MLACRETYYNALKHTIADRCNQQNRMCHGEWYIQKPIQLKLRLEKEKNT